jgi:hypothetical protein
MADTIEVLMDRIKNLKEYTVEVDLPENYKLHGVIPYDTKIQGKKGSFKVYALSYEEASNQIKAYLEEQQ